MSFLTVVFFFFYGGLVELRWIEVTHWSRNVGLSGTTIKLACCYALKINQISRVMRAEN